jgi:ribosome-binding protein aMBF1 (putative translation factor)
VNHSTWKTHKAKALAEQPEELGPKAQAVYDEAGLAIHIAQAVYKHRTALGWSQRELAEHAGMTQPAIARLETGLTLPSTRTLLRIAAALDQPLFIGIGLAA